MNGVMMADLTPTPKTVEVKKAYQNIAFKLIDKDKGIVEIQNKFFETNLRNFDFEWQLLEEGRIVQKGKTIVDLKPSEINTFELNGYDFPTASLLECSLQIQAKIKATTNWANAGHIVAWEEFNLKEVAHTLSNVSTKDKVSVKEIDKAVIISFKSGKVVFDKELGRIKSFNQDGNSIIDGGMDLAFNRAYIDNDKRLNLRKSWDAIDFQNLLPNVDSFSVVKEKNRAIIQLHKTYQSIGNTKGFKTEEQFIVYGNGLIDIKTSVSYVGKGEPITFPRIGYEVRVNKALNNSSWYGKGPGSSYKDRSTGMQLGVYDATIDEHFVNYARPQENGNKSEIRWGHVFKNDDHGVLFHSNKLLNFSFRKYTTEQLNNATHPYQLKANDFNILNIDFDHGALGNGSCGPIPMEKYYTDICDKSYYLRLHFNNN